MKGKQILDFESPQPSQIVIPVDVPMLIQSVYISPDAQEGLQEIVAGLLQTYGVSVPVNKSVVLAPPDYDTLA